MDSLFLTVEARDLAPKAFGRVPTGGQEHALRMGPGRSIQGRVVRDGQPISGIVIGAVQVSRDAATFVGERIAETNADGRFALLNLPPDEPLVLYGKVDGLKGLGAISERDIEEEPEGSARDLGPISLEPSLVLTGKVVLADGKPVPPHTRIAVDRMRAWDHPEQELAADGTIRFAPLPRETIGVSLRVPGYELTADTENLMPDYADTRMSLAGRLEQDTELKMVMTPVVDWPRPAPPRSGQEWHALSAKQEAVRARQLRGASSPP